MRLARTRHPKTEALPLAIASRSAAPEDQKRPWYVMVDVGYRPCFHRFSISLVRRACAGRTGKGACAAQEHQASWPWIGGNNRPDTASKCINTAGKSRQTNAPVLNTPGQELLHLGPCSCAPSRMPAQWVWQSHGRKGQARPNPCSVTLSTPIFNVTAPLGRRECFLKLPVGFGVLVRGGGSGGVRGG